MVEILNPGMQDISQKFINEFKGMTSNEIKLDELLEVRKNLIQIVKSSLTEEKRNSYFHSRTELQSGNFQVLIGSRIIHW